MPVKAFRQPWGNADISLDRLVQSAIHNGRNREFCRREVNWHKISGLSGMMKETAKDYPIPLINEAAQTAAHWINEIAVELGDVSRQTAYHALRGVLFAIRDRIMPQEAAHLGDQLPTLVRGIYYESYQHGGKPEKIRHLDTFLEKIRQETDTCEEAPDPAEALRVVSGLLARHVDTGQYEQVKRALPLEIQNVLGA